MSLVARIYLVMGAMVALITVIGAFSGDRTARFADTFIDYRATTKTSLLASELMQGISDVRLATLNYRLSNDPSALEKAKEHAAEVTRLAPEFIEQLVGYDVQSAIRRLPDLMEAHSLTIGQVALLRQQQNELVGAIEQGERDAQLDQIEAEALMLVSDAVDAVVDRQNLLGRSGETMAQSSTAVVNTLTALGAAIGLLFTFFTGKMMTHVFQKITGRMTQIADGNLELDVKSGNEKHEVGKITNVMVAVVENARKARERAAEVSESERRKTEQLEKERVCDERQRARLETIEIENREKDLARIDVLEAFQSDLERVMNEAVSGNFSVRMKQDGDDLNLSKVADLVNQQLDATETSVTDVVSGIGELAKGNLAIRIHGERSGVFLAMQEDFNASAVVMSNTMAKILESGNSVSETSVDLKNSSKDMSKRAEDNAATVEETSAAVEEITASIRQVVANAKAADQATQSVRKSADETRLVSTETESSIKEMTSASAQINRVVKVIEDIAFQINLLALNAGVEAARAGEAGLGFSVVASEVRALAQRSQEAVQEITQVIEQSNLSVEAGAHQVGLSRQALEGIIAEVEVASGQISEIAAAVEEQAKGIEEVNAAIRAIDVNAQKNAVTLETMMVSSKTLSEEAGQLSTALGEFKGVHVDQMQTKSMPNTKKLAHSEPTFLTSREPQAKISVASGEIRHQVSSLEDEGWDEF